MIYPKPTSFYMNANFVGDRGSPVTTDVAGFEPLILSDDRALAGRVTGQLQQVMMRRTGVLQGEYVFFARGCLAIDRNGTPIRANYDPEEDTAHTSVFNQYENTCLTDDFFGLRDQALRSWDQLPTVSDIPVLSEWYGAFNYHHFMVRFIPQVRIYPDADDMPIGVPEELLARPFQRDLLSKTYGRRPIVPLPHAFRAINPRLSYEPISAAGLDWLRAQIGARARRGDRRIYVSRGQSLVGRKGGNIVETDDFKAFLARHGFETISFGGGELSVLDQIQLLDGARVVFSAHGASLTNICYLEPGAAVLELFGRHWCHHSHMQLSLMSGLRYTGVICDIDADANIVPDVSLLTLGLERALHLTA